MAVSSTQAFLDLLAKSEVLPAPKLAAARAAVGSEPDLKAAARELIRSGVLTKWQTQMLLNERTLLKLGKYTLLEQLGSEEIGHVHLAEHSQMGRRVVIKTLGSKHTGNPEAVKRFLEEAQRIASLHHRNIIHLFDVSSESDRYYIVLENAEGKNLQSVVAGGPLSRELAADYVLQIAEGLAHAHGKGLYHGDVRLENLQVDDQGQVKILNFGVARLVETEFSADAAGDLAGLGKVAVALLTGKTDAAAFLGITSEGFDAICARLASSGSGEKFSSADEVVAAIKAWQSEQRAASTSAPKIQRTELEKPKKKAVAAAARPPKRAEPLTESRPEPAIAVADAPASAETVAEGIGAINIVTSARGKTSDTTAMPGVNISVSAPSPKSKSSTNVKPASKQKAKPKAAQADAGGGAASTPAAKKLNIPLPLLIGGGVGGGVLVVLLLVGVIAFFAWPRAPKQVASAEKDKKIEKPVDPDDEIENPEVKVATTPDPEPKKPEIKKPEEPAKPDPMPVVPAVAPPVDPAKPDPAKPVDPAQPNPAVPNPAVPNPAVPDPAKPAEPPKEPAPVAPVAPAVNPPANPALNPFKELPAVAELPPIGKPESTTPVSLGSFPVPPKDLVFIELAGGEKASKGKQVFSLKAARGGIAERDWEISMTPPAGVATVIALLSAKDDKLNFQWTDKATDVVVNQLRNCALVGRTGAHNHVLALRAPTTPAPLNFSADKAMKVDYPIEFPPDPESIEVEITGFEGDFPPRIFDPKPSFEAVKGLTRVQLGKDKSAPLRIKVESQLKKNVTITATPMFRITGFNKEEKYTKVMLNKAYQQADIGQKNLFQAILEIDSVKDAQKASELAPQRNLFELDRAKCQEAVSQCEELKKTMDLLHNKGKIHFRVYYLAGEQQQVDLVRTGPATAAAPAAVPGEAPPAVLAPEPAK